MSSSNRFRNTRKSSEDIQKEIAARRAAGLPSKQLEDELHATGPERVYGLDGMVDPNFPDNMPVEERKTEIKNRGGWTGPVNRQINRSKSTADISSEIATRRAQGKPTQQLEDELNSRE